MIAIFNKFAGDMLSELDGFNNASSYLGLPDGESKSRTPHDWQRRYLGGKNNGAYY